MVSDAYGTNYKGELVGAQSQLEGAHSLLGEAHTQLDSAQSWLGWLWS